MYSKRRAVRKRCPSTHLRPPIDLVLTDLFLPLPDFQLHSDHNRYPRVNGHDLVRGTTSYDNSSRSRRRRGSCLCQVTHSAIYRLKGSTLFLNDSSISRLRLNSSWNMLPRLSLPLRFIGRHPPLFDRRTAFGGWSPTACQPWPLLSLRRHLAEPTSPK